MTIFPPQNKPSRPFLLDSPQSNIFCLDIYTVFPVYGCRAGQTYHEVGGMDPSSHRSANFIATPVHLTFSGGRRKRVVASPRMFRQPLVFGPSSSPRRPNYLLTATDKNSSLQGAANAVFITVVGVFATTEYLPLDKRLCLLSCKTKTNPCLACAGEMATHGRHEPAH
jgi:hypothetical protein